MKQILNVLAILILTCFSNDVLGQADFDVPENFELKTDEDFNKYEPDVVAAAKWLEKTDLDKEVEKRKQVNGFVVQYISGSPTITVEINEAIAKIYGENEQLLALYLASYARHCIENKSWTKTTAIKAGIVSMIAVYKKQIQIKKSRELDKLIKLTDAELDKYVASKFK